MKRLFLTLLCFFASLSLLQAQSVKVISFNIRYDNPSDTPNNWDARKGLVSATIVNSAPDLLGVQEALSNQVAYLDSELKGYARQGVARDDGDCQGEYSAVYYNTNRFERIDGGTFWLSQTPDSVSLGWDGACKRIVSWVELLDKTSGKPIFYFNTHFDHIGPMARMGSAELVLQRISDIAAGAPAILSGDLNAEINDKPIQHLLETGLLKDSRMEAKKVVGPATTFHDFGKTDGGVIDYIMATKHFKVKKHEVIVSPKGGELFLSDHNPIVAEFTL